MKKILLNLLLVVTIGFVNTNCGPFGSQMGKKIEKPETIAKNSNTFDQGSDIGDGSHGTSIKEAWPFTCFNYYDMFWMNVVAVLGTVIAQSYYTFALYDK